ncbi:MAG TPA: TAXI family TRAP transporter solute-binding subunit [Verrucomicrobiae bacterium]|nr:TAXI family TRAP transporter solute-binding subunit [Verrucomicrobiae bacterium]
MEEGNRTALGRFVDMLMETFGLSRVAAMIAAALIALVGCFGVYWIVHASPPHVVVITAGTPGSSFETNAFQYRAILARSGVTLKILPSHGSMENLQRLQDPTVKVDVGFVQSGITNGSNHAKLFSLGSVAYQPLLVFHRGSESLNFLSELAGKRLAIGPEGSGTHALALSLLELNGIRPRGSTELLDLDADDAAKALLDGKADAVFLMGDSASPQVMRRLLLSPDVQMLNFSQADGYTRRITYLSKLDLPMGSIDFGKNLPIRDTFLVAPTVELLARPGLHPALSDLLLEAAREVHGKAGLLRRKNEFPAPLENEFPISAEANRFYKSGKTFLYRSLPFWLASLVNPILVAIVPVIVLLIPGLKAIPFVFRLRVRLRIYRWYRALLMLEKEVLLSLDQDNRKVLLARLDQIEQGVNRMKVPVSFADQFYALRGYIAFVRTQLVGKVVG